MFEYLMPGAGHALAGEQPAEPDVRQVVRRQIEYGSERGVPWGISESAFNARDIDFTYQYSSFGVPGLGLKRGLSEDLVIAPTLPRLPPWSIPSAALQNFRAPAGRQAAAAPTVFTRRSTTPARACRKAKRSPSCAPTWRTIRACRSLRSPTRLRRRHVQSLSCRADRAGHRTSDAGAHAAQCAGGPAPRRRSLRGGAGSRTCSSGCAPLHHASRTHAAHRICSPTAVMP